MMDKKDIFWKNTKDAPEARNTVKAQYVNVSRDPERIPFQWDATKNADKMSRLLIVLINDTFHNNVSVDIN